MHIWLIIHGACNPPPPFSASDIRDSLQSETEYFHFRQLIPQSGLNGERGGGVRTHFWRGRKCFSVYSTQDAQFPNNLPTAYTDGLGPSLCSHQELYFFYVYFTDQHWLLWPGHCRCKRSCMSVQLNHLLWEEPARQHLANSNFENSDTPKIETTITK